MGDSTGAVWIGGFEVVVGLVCFGFVCLFSLSYVVVWLVWVWIWGLVVFFVYG